MQAQALKALVIFLAVLILAGMALLVYGLMTRTGGPRSDGPSAGGAPFAVGAASGQAGAPASLDLPIPDGCTIAGTELAGERLVLRLDGLPGRDCQQVLVVDLASGRLLARVRAVPGEAAGGAAGQ